MDIIKIINDWIQLNNTDIILDLSNLNLTEIPDLPSNVYKLNLSSNKIQKFDNLPKNLKYLNCNNNELFSVKNLPNTLTYLDCSNNHIYELRNLPINLTNLNCSQNNLTNLNYLPENLIQCVCKNNYIAYLKDLPKNLNLLDCEFNRISIIYELPLKLESCNLSDNNLEQINLNNLIKLNYFECNNNNITELKLPDNLKHLKCENNKIKKLVCCKNLQTLLCNNNNISELLLNDDVKTVICNNNNIDELKLPEGLLNLQCKDNDITNLNLPNSLINLNCYMNDIKNLNININLKSIICDNHVKLHNYQYIINNNVVDYENFNNFYLQNIQECFLKNTYPLNYENITKWIDEIQKYNDDKLNLFAYFISSTLQHVSFKSFYDNVQILGYKIHEHITNTLLQNNTIKFYFHIPDINKSNLWVLCLLWKILTTINYNNIFIISDLYILTSKNIDYDFQVIYIDDCSYSGMQLLDNLLSYKNNFDIYIFITYISKSAYKRISSYDLNIQYSEMIDNFVDKLQSQENIQIYKEVIHNYTEYINDEDEIKNTGICNIYFDHKLADFISVFQSIYAYGRLPDGRNSGSFISGCENFYIQNVVNTHTLDIQNNLKIICPPAFYKTIKYKNIELLNKIYL